MNRAAEALAEAASEVATTPVIDMVVEEVVVAVLPLPPQPAKVAQNVRVRTRDSSLFIIPPQSLFSSCCWGVKNKKTPISIVVKKGV
jgi:hypothetical protein